MSCMGKPQDEIGVGVGVTFSAGLYQSIFRDERFGIIRRQDAVKTVAVSATCNQCGVAQMLNLSVVTFIIGLSGDGEDLVPFHHLFVGMTLLTDFGMELLPKCHHFGLITF